MALVTIEQTFADPSPTPVSAKLQSVTVTGRVDSPGKIKWTPDLTLVGAIIRAGGLSNGHGAEIVYIVRGKVRTRYKLDPIILQRAPDPKLLPGDKVEVPIPVLNF